MQTNRTARGVTKETIAVKRSRDLLGAFVFGTVRVKTVGRIMV